MSLFKFVEIPVITTINGNIVSKDIYNNISQGFIFGAVMKEFDKELEQRKEDLISSTKERLKEIDENLEKIEQIKKDFYNKEIERKTKENETYKKEYNEEREKHQKIYDEYELIHNNIIYELNSSKESKDYKKSLTSKLMEMKKKMSVVAKTIEDLDKEFNNKIYENERYLEYWMLLEKIPGCEKREELISEKKRINYEINTMCNDLWEDLLFFESISKQGEKINCKVSNFLFRETKSKLQIGEIIEIDQKFIAYAITNECIIKSFSPMAYQTKIFTNWNGAYYSNPEYIKSLIKPNWIVRVQLKEKNIDCSYTWYMKILCKEGNVLYGYSTDTYKSADLSDYDCKNCFKCFCIYKFNVNSIIEIPHWQDDTSNAILNRYATNIGRGTGLVFGTKDCDYVEM